MEMLVRIGDSVLEKYGGVLLVRSAMHVDGAVHLVVIVI